MSTTKPPTITIIGGGIGGLTLAAGLHLRKVPFHLYEAAPAFKEIGLGISLGPAAYRAMPLIHPQIQQIYNSLITTHADSPGYEEYLQTWFEIVWASGPQEGDTLMNLKALPSGQTALRRADFLNALVELVLTEFVHFGKRLSSLVERDGGVMLRFEDGEVVNADVVIGCDGIRSKVKESMIPLESLQTRPVYSGMYGYRAVLEMDEMVKAVGDKRARVATIYVGRGAYAISYPIMRAKLVNVGIYMLSDQPWEYDSWVRPAEREDMERDTRGMGRYVKSLVEHMPDPSQWAIFEHPHISTYARSRIAILGDAAHASTPHQGAGAGQAIEDAHVLAELLSDSRAGSVDGIVAAFKAYDDIRRPRSQKVVTSSKENADIFCLCFDGVRDDPMKLKETLDQRLKWLWDLDVQDQVERAREKMVEYLDIQGIVKD
ncbi:Monooxygenase FAD-binding [Penicillium vulpinum]|uniref:Monooxygenase FAD-binding n=1 Tax=Penicillium vulpinum TaxID=29845 RepID=UPI002548D17D|nr:Monooxygenase FAD-binding [Penicillium vulpinum]KAJ5970504.1 Monooxygenase FAD-binding [Penicillium vulpinum]